MKKTNIRAALILSLGSAFFWTACKKDIEPNPNPSGNQPTILDCYYFDGTDRVSKDNPNSAVDYIVTCRMDITADVSIEPGVVIEFEKNTGFIVRENGSLSAVGTEGKPIVFRGTDRLLGHWDGIFIDGSESQKNELKYVEVSDGGGREFANNTQGGVMVYAYSQLKMSHSKLTNNLNYAYNGHTAEFNKTSIQNNIFSGSKYPALINTDNLDQFKNNTCTDNEVPVVLVYPTQLVDGNITWHKGDVPYRLTDNGHYNLYKTLTIAPGTKIEFPQDGKIKIDGGTGGLVCVGTASDPIILTGIVKAPNAWNGVYVDGAYPLNEIAYTHFEYSGYNSPEGNVYLWYDAVLNIHHTKFKNIGGCAINTRVDGAANLVMDAATIEYEDCLEGIW